MPRNRKMLRKPFMQVMENSHIPITMYLLPRSYSVGNSKQIGSANNVVVQKEELAHCRSDLPWLCGLKGRHLQALVHSCEPGLFLLGSSMQLTSFLSLRGKEETEEVTEKKEQSGFLSSMMCLGSEMFRTGFKQVGTISQLYFAKSASKT